MKSDSSPAAVLVLGSFVADVAFRAARLPGWGETLMGSGFAMGPGGKGSNQAVAAARAGARVQMCSKLGRDVFGRIAREMWRAEGIDDALTRECDAATGSAAILIDDARGENAIIVVPGACFTLSADEVERDAAAAITNAGVFLAQLELPLETVERGLRIAQGAGVPTILNPAPASSVSLAAEMLGLVDFLIPNESEAAALTGIEVNGPESAEAAGRALQAAGAANVIVTLGERGALLLDAFGAVQLVPAFRAGTVLDTTGAGDAFCGGFAAALAERQALADAVRFGCATAGISVTRHGTAPSMPRREEVEALLG